MKSYSLVSLGTMSVNSRPSLTWVVPYKLTPSRQRKRTITTTWEQKMGVSSTDLPAECWHDSFSWHQLLFYTMLHILNEERAKNMKHMHDLRWILATQSKSYTIEIPLKHHQKSLKFKCYHSRHIYFNICTGKDEFQINSGWANIQFSTHRTDYITLHEWNFT